jgi:hypothetical protein
MERGHHKQEDADHHRNQPRSDHPANAFQPSLVPGMRLRSGRGRAGSGKCPDRDDAARASAPCWQWEVALLRFIRRSAFDLPGFVARGSRVTEKPRNVRADSECYREEAL